jgi:hypothetical protein
VGLRRHDRQDSSQGDGGGLDGLDGLGTYARRITIPDEHQLLEQIVVEQAIALLMLDPINSFITRSVDADRDAEIRRVLDPSAGSGLIGPRSSEPGLRRSERPA